MKPDTSAGRIGVRNPTESGVAVEIAPKSIRIRKRHLSEQDRRRVSRATA